MDETSKAALRWLRWSLAIVAGLFIWLGLARSWSAAYLVLIGSMTPASANAEPVAFFVSVSGYLVVPVLIGSVVAGLFTRSVERAIVRNPEAVVGTLTRKWARPEPVASPTAHAQGPVAITNHDAV